MTFQLIILVTFLVMIRHEIPISKRNGDDVRRGAMKELRDVMKRLNMIENVTFKEHKKPNPSMNTKLTEFALLSKIEFVS